MRVTILEGNGEPRWYITAVGVIVSFPASITPEALLALWDLPWLVRCFCILPPFPPHPTSQEASPGLSVLLWGMSVQLL